jgi:hypothetical protein
MSFSYTQKELFHPFSYYSGITLSMEQLARSGVSLHKLIPKGYLLAIF